MLLQLPATISKVSSMSNRALRLQIDTQEGLEDDQMAQVMRLYEKYGWFCFLQDTHITEDDIIDLPPLPKEADEKSPATRLRNVIYRYAEKIGKTEGFNAFYTDQVEKIIVAYKEKLN